MRIDISKAGDLLVSHGEEVEEILRRAVRNALLDHKRAGNTVASWEPVKGMNEYGSSLIFGHPQGPTGARLIAELIEILKRRGGGIGLFTGCAAGDTGAALVLRVED